MAWAARRSDSVPPTCGVVAALALRNAAEAVIPPGAYVPVNLAVGGLLTGIARVTGATWESLGLGAGSIGPSLRAGLPAAGAAAAVLTAGAALPATRHLFDDERVRVEAGPGELAHQLLVRIPVGTVAFEELAFRGVLLDLVLRQLPPARALAINGALFGLWHVAPTLATASANGIRGRARLAMVAGSVLTTAAAGELFSALRLRSGHLLAPALLHLACNDTGYALSWWVRSRAGRHAEGR